MCRTSRRRDGSSAPDVGLKPPSPTPGLTIGPDSTCYDACLGELACEKCKNLLSQHQHSGHSWGKLGATMASMVSVNRRCENPWNRSKYIDAPKVRSFLKQRCQSILDFFNDNGVAVVSTDAGPAVAQNANGGDNSGNIDERMEEVGESNNSSMEDPVIEVEGATNVGGGATMDEPSQTLGRESEMECDECCSATLQASSEDTVMEDVSTVKKYCCAWTGDKYCPLLKEALKQHVDTLDMSNSKLTSFPLAERYKGFRGYDRLQFVLEDGRFVLRSTDCCGEFCVPTTSHAGRKLCDDCSSMANNVSLILRESKKTISLTSKSRLTAKKRSMYPKEVCDMVDDVRKMSKKERLNLNRRLSRLVKKNSQVAVPDDVPVLEDIISKAMPHVTDTMEKEVFKQSLLMLRDKSTGAVKGKPKYHDSVIKYALSLLSQVNKQTYDSLAQILLLPTHRHIRRLKKALVDAEGVAEDGPRREMIAKMREVAIENGWMKEDDDLDVIASFDSMKMRGSMVLSTEEKTRNRLIGVDLTDGHSVIEAEFKAAVRKLSKASMSEEDFATSMAEALPLNTEHMVYYVRAVEPGISLCFICAAYNLKTIRAADIHQEMEEVILTLYEYGFNARFITCDNASSNASWIRARATLSAFSFIPAEILESFGLDGEFGVAFRHPITDKFVFIIADPPHCIKRVGCALENRDMLFEDKPIKMMMLYDVFVSIKCKQGKPQALQHFRKLSERHFKGTNFDAMDVKRSAQVLSSTMRKAIDTVCNDPAAYPLRGCGPGVDRKELYKHIRQFVVHMNHLFDLCNSCDPDTNNPILKMTQYNAEKYAKQFLEILGWVNRWRSWVKSLPGGFSKNKKHFLPDETFASLQSVCYGFASAIYFLCKTKKRVLTLCRVNQDVNEHHFGNTRSGAGSHNNPNQRECMAAVVTSSVIRLLRIEKGNCSVLLGTKRTQLPVDMALGKKRQRGKHY